MVISRSLCYLATDVASWNLQSLSTLRAYALSQCPSYPDILYCGDSDADTDLGREMERAPHFQLSGAS